MSVFGRPPGQQPSTAGSSNAGSSKASLRRKKDITYGIEFQFLVAVVRNGDEDPHPRDTRGFVRWQPGSDYGALQKTIVDIILNNVIRAARFRAWTYNGPPYPDWDLVRRMDLASQSVAAGLAYTQWVVVADEDSLWFPGQIDDSPYGWIGVKVKTNKRNTNRINHFDRVAHFCTGIQHALRIRTLPSSSLMIHVGEEFFDIMEYEMIPRSLRVFCTLWWFLESRIMALAHPSRHDHVRCRALRDFSVLAHTSNRELERITQESSMSEMNWASCWQDQMRSIMPRNRLSLREEAEVEFIWRVAEAKRLCQMLEVYTVEFVKMPVTGTREPQPILGRGSIGLQGICENAWPESPDRNNDGHTGTIEFRFMQGTCDPLLTAHWLAIVTRLFEISRSGSDYSIMALIFKCSRPHTKYSSIELLFDLGLFDQVQVFRDMQKDYAAEQQEANVVVPLVVPLAEENEGEGEGGEDGAEGSLGGEDEISGSSSIDTIMSTP
ncbi:hypothetical protein F5Y04DRAFT_292826 [Hypomontagnella monticulosa]|nr:hypothetical protein F5Y04DRAFT_292826 [Hypomontagnella monticulosa]